jgi:hypothetical protein
MLHLPAGTTICAEATYDNTVNKPNNPFKPPREVREQGGACGAPKGCSNASSR